MSTLKAQVLGESDNPHTLDSDQMLRWKHHLGSSTVLASALNKDKVWPELSGRSQENTLYEGRWVLTKFALDGDSIPRTLLIATILAAEHLGTGLVIGWRGESPGSLIAQQVMALADIDACRIAFTQTLDGQDDLNLHLMGVNSVRGSYNSRLVVQVERELLRALASASANSEGSVVRWKDLPKVWRLWLKRGNYAGLAYGPVGFNVRHDNGLSIEMVRRPNWEAPPNLALRKADLETAVLLMTLNAVGIIEDTKRHTKALRKFIEKIRPGKTLIEVSTEDQGDYTPDGPPVPHLTAFAYMMLRGEDGK